MKLTITSLFLFINFLGFAQTKISIADGDFHNPSIWSPAGVPNLINTDSLFIDHNLTFDQKIIVNWDYFEIQPGACLTSVSGLDTISYIDVNGSVLINGDLNVGWFNNQCELSIINGKVNAETQFNNLDTLVINATAIISTYKWYCASGVSNDGQLSCSYFNNNGGSIVGSGKICVSDTLRNQGNVSGTIDICDATPSGPGDYNIGTYGSNVTFCSASPCSPTVINCTTTGLDVMAKGINYINVFPNPASNSLKISCPEPIAGLVELININGQLHFSEPLIGNSKTLDVSMLPKGIYLLKLISERGVVTRKVMVE